MTNSIAYPNSYWHNVWLRFKENRLAMFGFYLIFSICSMAIIGPFISGYSYDEIHLALKNQSPSTAFWFGTDDLGRDIFTRTWYGARISLFVGISAALIDLFIGVFWGCLAGFIGGRVDDVLMRIADIVYAIPSLLLVILLTVCLGHSLPTIILALSLFGWITMARIMRGQMISLKNNEYILASQALGAGLGRILCKHLIPNSQGPILVTLTLTIPSAIFTEAFLSYLGLGVQAPIASWGTMASEGALALLYYPWRLFFPAFFISATILAFNLIGDGLRDSFDQMML